MLSARSSTLWPRSLVGQWVCSLRVWSLDQRVPARVTVQRERSRGGAAVERRRNFTGYEQDRLGLSREDEVCDGSCAQVDLFFAAVKTFFFEKMPTKAVHEEKAKLKPCLGGILTLLGRGRGCQKIVTIGSFIQKSPFSVSFFPFRISTQ